MEDQIKMDLEIEWGVAGIAVVLWLVFIGFFLYLPRFAGSASYFDSFGVMPTIVMFVVLLPISYYVVLWQANK